METLRLEINPLNGKEFVTKSQIVDFLYYYCDKVQKFELISNNRAAYGCKAYQLINVNEDDALKIKKVIESENEN